VNIEAEGRARDARRERQSESDDEVRRNLLAGMAKVFDKVKRHVKGSERKSRTEAFLEWAEENPGGRSGGRCGSRWVIDVN
jgi:hypothetical protein